MRLFPAQRAALEYYVLTEEFDRTLPGYWNPREPDCWMPLNLSEANSNAWRTHRAMIARGLEQGFHRDDFHEARRWAARFRYSEQKWMLEEWMLEEWMQEPDLNTAISWL